jgi:hypothetical protein
MHRFCNSCIGKETVLLVCSLMKLQERASGWEPRFATFALFLFVQRIAGVSDVSNEAGLEAQSAEGRGL